MATKTKKLSGISRIDSNATHGWFVRAYRQGKTYSKFFSDLKNKGKGKALQLAIAHRDELRMKVGPPLPKARVMKSNRGNRSGVIGVSRTKRVSPAGTTAHFFTVSWRPEPNLAKNKFFAYRPDNEDKVFKQAVKFRRDREKEIQALLTGNVKKAKRQK